MPEKNIIDGILLIDKPQGITSYDVIRKLKKTLSPNKIGHAGTLDPLATGLLVILLGKGTKLSSKFLEARKAYQGIIRLGVETDSDDITGNILQERDVPKLDPTQRAECLKKIKDKFLGKQLQLPPQYSAVKVGGKKSYEVARKGGELKLEPREIEIESIELEFVSDLQLKYFIRCSKGTYIRSIARDLGRYLEVGACIEEIRRIESEPFDIKNAVLLDQIDLSCIEGKLVKISNNLAG
ncbi:MAG: tRNA pseudouridine(55) synthase TruB [Proteobacteria bacterium]|nr:tRNA pseudouridine(55) synthase TruB [Pseudomonadota bacterium]